MGFCPHYGFLLSLEVGILEKKKMWVPLKTLPLAFVAVSIAQQPKASVPQALNGKRTCSV